jgi:urease accessory protein
MNRKHHQVIVMKSMHSFIVLALCVFAGFAPPAQAHLFGAHGAGLAEGLAHPLIGLDHLLAALAAGAWAAQAGGRFARFAPAAFVGVMAEAAFLGSSGPELPLLESAIAGSVLALGLLVAFAARPEASVNLALVGLFAFFHGYAHGTELSQTAAPALYALGLALTTAALLGAGIALGFALRRRAPLARLCGAMIALTGLYLLAAA